MIGRGMYFKPYPWLSFFASLVFAALIYLGVWQVERYGYKQALISKIEAQAKLPAQELAKLLETKKITELLYHQVKFHGHYTDGQEILVRGQYKKSSRVILYGFYVFTPFKITSGDVYKTVMVERGFITEEIAKNPALYRGLTKHEIVINGVVKYAEKQGSFLPNNPVNSDRWFWRDIEAMGKMFKLSKPTPFYISSTDYQQLAFPKISKVEIKSASSHLSYLITWFALAAGLLILYIYIHAYSGRLGYKKHNKSNKE